MLREGEAEFSLPRVFVAGAFTGAVLSVTVTPVELVKVQAQARSGVPRLHRLRQASRAPTASAAFQARARGWSTPSAASCVVDQPLRSAAWCGRA